MRFLLIVILLLSSTSIFSQSFEVSSFFSKSNKNGNIKGIVTDGEGNNEPLAFVTIGIKNSDIEAETNIDGSFSIIIKPGTYTLVYRFIGYKTAEIENVVVASNGTIVNNQSLVALTMNTDISLVFPM
ncbi:MAG: carboxypeptidase-like regulatory domain-containing protein [Lutibacter sp.]|jgi:hypothetical protein